MMLAAPELRPEFTEGLRFEPCDKRRFYKKDNRVFRRFRQRKRGETRFYWCKACKCWHLTSMEKE